MSADDDEYIEPDLFTFLITLSKDLIDLQQAARRFRAELETAPAGLSSDRYRLMADNICQTIACLRSELKVTSEDLVRSNDEAVQARDDLDE